MKTDPRIDTYINEAPAFAQPIIRRVRQLVHTACPEIEEAVKWSRPSFLYRGRLLCGVAAFKAHATVGFWHQKMEAVIAADGHKTDGAAGLLGRLTQVEDLPDDRTMLRYFKTAMDLHDSGASVRPRPKPKAPLPVPADLAAALKKSRQAAGHWKDFSPSCRREYIEWITEARRPETRASRLATTLQWVAAGKGRNWKYQNC